MSAPVSVTVEIYINGAWTAITSYVRLDPGIDITLGIQNEGGISDASRCDLVVNNADGRFTPRNTSGAYYPYLKRNTPLRVKVGSTVRFLGEVSEFPTRWTPGGGSKHVWANLTASGMLRRLQHASSLQSTLTTAIQSLYVSGGTITGYWPCEDEDGSTVLASGLPGGAPATFTGSPDLAAVDLSVGTHAVPTWGAATAKFTPATASSTKFTAGFYVKLPAAGSLTGGEELFRCDVNGTAQSWRVLYSPGSGGGLFLQVIANDGTTELLATGSITGLDGLTFYVKIECSNSGSNVAYAFSTNDAGGTVSGSIASRTVGAPTLAQIGAGTIAIPAAADVAIGHVVLGSSDTSLFSSTFDSGRSGYAGETVNARMARLATLYGITIDVVGGSFTPTEMGAQPDGTLLDVLRAAEKADAGGILRDGVGVTGSTPVLNYITRTGRYNELRSVLALNYASGHLSEPLEPVDDDAQLKNQAKVNREGGASARYVDSTSALGSAAYPTGVGPYPFEDTYGTYSDSALPYLASWVVRRGTVDETRWPALTVDLVKNASLVTDAEALRPGHRITVSNLPTFSGATSAALQVVGWREHLTSWERTITFICEPGAPFLVFELNNSTYGRLDSAYRLAF